MTSSAKRDEESEVFRTVEVTDADSRQNDVENLGLSAIVFSERLIRRLMGHLQDIHQYILFPFLIDNCY